MDEKAKKLILILENYLNDISVISEKFSNEFHIMQRECTISDPTLYEIFKELSDKTPKFTLYEDEKNLWPGFVTKTELLECAERTKKKIDSLAK